MSRCHKGFINFFQNTGIDFFKSYCLKDGFFLQKTSAFVKRLDDGREID